MGCASSGLKNQIDASTSVKPNITSNEAAESTLPLPTPVPPAQIPKIPTVDDKEAAAEPARRKVKKFIKPPDHLVSSCSEESEIEADGISAKCANSSSLSSTSGEGGGGNSGGQRLTYDEEFWMFHNLPASGKMSYGCFARRNRVRRLIKSGAMSEAQLSDFYAIFDPDRQGLTAQQFAELMDILVMSYEKHMDAVELSDKEVLETQRVYNTTNTNKNKNKNTNTNTNTANIHSTVASKSMRPSSNGHRRQRNKSDNVSQSQQSKSSPCPSDADTSLASSPSSSPSRVGGSGLWRSTSSDSDHSTSNSEKAARLKRLRSGSYGSSSQEESVAQQRRAVSQHLPLPLRMNVRKEDEEDKGLDGGEYMDEKEEEEYEEKEEEDEEDEDKEEEEEDEEEEEEEGEEEEEEEEVAVVEEKAPLARAKSLPSRPSPSSSSSANRSPSASQKKGFLLKRDSRDETSGGSSGAAQNRFFTLESGVLTYYDHVGKTQGLYKREVCLRGAVLRLVDATTLEIVTAAASISLEVKNERDRDDWARAIREHMKGGFATE